MNERRFTLTHHALKRFAFFLRDSRGKPAVEMGEATDSELTAARRKLESIEHTATYRKTDRQGRELWRSPPSAYNLRVSPS